MDGAAAYLEHANRSSSEEDDACGELARVGSAFAVLAVEDGDESDDGSEHDEEHASPSSENESDDASHDDLSFPEDATVDDIIAAVTGTDATGAVSSNTWAWSTGRSGASDEVTKSDSQSAKKKKTLLMKGEKKHLKKRHMNEVRTTRSQKKHGFTPFDVKHAIERLASITSKKHKKHAEWHPPNGGVCGFREAKTIKAIAKCFPTLVCEISKKPKNRKLSVSVRIKEDEGGSSSYPVPLNGTRAAFLAAPVPSREEFLKDPERLAKLAKKVGARRAGIEDKNRLPPTTRDGHQGNGSYNAPKGTSTRRTTRTNTRDTLLVNDLSLDVFTKGGTLRDDETLPEQSEPGSSEPSSVPSFRSLQQHGTDRTDFGAFEAHTSGFGSAMLTKMGFTPGEGLGAKGEGITVPVEARSRAKNLGLGASKEK